MLAVCRIYGTGARSALEIESIYHYHSCLTLPGRHRPGEPFVPLCKKENRPMKVIAILLLASSVTIIQAARAEGNAADGAVIGYSCLGCHGIENYHNAYPSYHVPRLGGQKRAYVEHALRAYRDGSRKHPTMAAQGGSLSDSDIENIGAWLEQFGAVTDVVTLESVAGIDAATACVACHGEAGVGVVPQPPTLSGQHQDYLKVALQQYRDGSRSGTVMSAFAATLTDEDIEAITHYYASQPGVFTPATKN